MRVSDVMTREVVAVAPDLPVDDAAALLDVGGFGGAPVASGGCVLGVVSESDLRDAMRSGLTVRDVMTTPAIGVPPTASISAAAALMAEAGVNRLPVIREGKLIGIVARADLIRAVARRVDARAPQRPESELAVGDRIAVVRSGHAPGDRNGAGEVLEVLGPSGREVYRVRWVDGTETFYRPGHDVLVVGREPALTR